MNLPRASGAGGAEHCRSWREHTELAVRRLHGTVREVAVTGADVIRLPT